MSEQPVLWVEREQTRKKQTVSAAVKPAAAVNIRRLTVMLTEICNLDCWMCDFAKSKRLTKVLPYSPAGFVELLSHPGFSQLKTLTFTGGEPFAYPEILPLYQGLAKAFPQLRCNFSTNCTLLPKMLPVFDAVENWNKVGMLVSIDGMQRHDEQRGKDGAFDKTLANLEEIRRRYPQLAITLKFTITPVNYDELLDTYEFLNARGFRFTVKMLEHNPHYTNKLAVAGLPGEDGGSEPVVFSEEQLASIEQQLKTILERVPRARNSRRVAEIEEVLASLAPDWTRAGRCASPSDVAFLDCDQNLFTCKEYAPVINLAGQDLSELTAAEQYRQIVEHERCNTGRCTRCTSQMKRGSEIARWLGYLASLVR